MRFQIYCHLCRQRTFPLATNFLGEVPFAAIPSGSRKQRLSPVTTGRPTSLPWAVSLLGELTKSSNELPQQVHSPRKLLNSRFSIGRGQSCKAPSSPGSVGTISGDTSRSYCISNWNNWQFWELNFSFAVRNLWIPSPQCQAVRKKTGLGREIYSGTSGTFH